MARWIKDEDGNNVPGYFEYCGGSGRAPAPALTYRFPSDKPSMRRLDMGTCHFCHKTLRLKPDGTMRTHGHYVS